MTAFDPEKFEDKYLHYVAELEQAYKEAFSVMNEQYDSDIVHAIDQQILDESEPIYVGGGTFRIELPEDPLDRLSGVVADDEKLNATLDRYVEELEAALADVFEFADA